MRKSLLALPLLVACGGSTESEPFEMAKSSLSRDMAPAAPAADLAQLAQDNAAFGADLYAKLPKADSDNVFFSPYSISSALAMTFAGARGSTATEIAKAMHYSLPPERLHASFNAVDLQLASRGQGAKAADGKAFRLNVVNSTFGQRGYPFEKPFLDTLAQNYGAGVRLCDFAKQPEPARVMINDWVSDRTETRIQDLLPAGVITSDTRMVLVNAVYFNAAWAEPFDAQSTKPDTFTQLDGAKVQAEMMTKEISGASYASDDLMTAVELPYDGKQTSMVLVMPRGDFKTFESKLDGAREQAVFAKLAPKPVVVTLPKFTIKGEGFSLKPALQALGMKVPFVGGEADFTGIVKPSVDALYIQDAIHKAFVKVDEKGTEAAAATAVIIGRVTAIQDPLTFVANKPFFFFVRDVPTGTVLFQGRVASPK